MLKTPRTYVPAPLSSLDEIRHTASVPNSSVVLNRYVLSNKLGHPVPLVGHFFINTIGCPPSCQNLTVRPLPAATLSTSNFTYAHSPGFKIPAAVPLGNRVEITTPSHMSPPYPSLHSHTPTRDATLMASTAEPSDGLHSPLSGA